MKTKKYMKEIKILMNFSIKYAEKSLQDNIIDKSEYESLCNIYTKYVDENKNESFLQI